MHSNVIATLKRFVALFRLNTTVSWTVMLPLLIVAVTWPLLQLWFQNEHATFMMSFMLAAGLRLMLPADGGIRKMRSQISNRNMANLALLLGPAVIAVLIRTGEPIWCQRFLSLYFLVISGLYVLDVIDGRHMMVENFLPADRNRAADMMMTRVMAIYQMSLFLLNETMIAQSSLTVWLVYFALLPLLSQRVLLALMRTVDEAYAKGYGRS